ncbi:MAG: small basic family protein [Clostridiales bacterium]
MWLPVMGLIVGLLLGSLITFTVPVAYASYLAIAVLAGSDSLLGGWRAVLEDKFDGVILLSGFFVNALIAAMLAYLGDLVGLDLYLAAVVAFGIRIFSNIGAIRHALIMQHRQRLERRKPQ